MAHRQGLIAQGFDSHSVFLVGVKFRNHNLHRMAELRLC
jgi:hypothetical protein